MKKLLFIAALLITTTSWAQIEVMERKKPHEISRLKYGYAFHCSLSYEQPDSGSTDTTYFITFQDRRYTHASAIESFAHTGSINDLYDLFTSQIKKDVDSEASANIGGTKLILITTKSLGIKVLYIFKGNANFALTEANIKKLFRKK